MSLFRIFLLMLALVLAVLAGFGIGKERWHLGWVGFAAFMLAELLANAP